MGYVCESQMDGCPLRQSQNRKPLNVKVNMFTIVFIYFQSGSGTHQLMLAHLTKVLCFGLEMGLIKILKKHVITFWSRQNLVTLMLNLILLIAIGKD